MDDRLKMRASDADRQEVIERLRAALDEGRLKMEEYLDRMAQASEAVTYGDLAPLYADLPVTSSVARHEPSAPPRAPLPGQPPAAPLPGQPPAAPRHGAVAAYGWAGLPAPLKVLWTIWAAVVSVNLVIWGLVSATTVQFIYPWPVWVAGPWGIILLVVSIAVAQARRGGQPG